MPVPAHARKADFQLSLGLIVTVVFAVVLLSLAVLWIQQFFPGLQSISTDLLKQAQDNIAKTFRTTNNNFAIWPERYELRPGQELKMSAGINNNAPDGKDHLYVINVIPTAASTCPAGDLSACTASSGQTLAAYLQGWVVFDRTADTFQINDVGYKAISIRPPNDAVKGTYIFKVIPCYDKNGALPVSDQCTPGAPNIWGNARSLTVTVTS